MATLRSISLALCVGGALASNIKEYGALGPIAGGGAVRLHHKKPTGLEKVTLGLLYFLLFSANP